jgi:hypothetical protein
MKLVSLKMTKAEREKQYEPSKMAEDAPIYPWGLTVNLDDATIEKLGNVPMTVGAEVMIHAYACVTSSEDRQTEGDSHRRSVSLQIKEMALAPYDEKKSDTAGALYNGDKA